MGVGAEDSDFARLRMLRSKDAAPQGVWNLLI
jgi:hypothetical protein